VSTRLVALLRARARTPSGANCLCRPCRMA
jgi:hypothetical protein